MGRIASLLIAAMLPGVSPASADGGKRSLEEPRAMRAVEGRKPALPPAVAVRALEPAQEAEAPVSVRGVVTRGGSPVKDARVELRLAGEEPLLQARRTDAAGEFAFEPLGAAAYDVEAGDGAASSAATGVRPAAGRAVRLELSLDPRPHTFTVRGRVTAPDGTPAAGARVQATTYTIDWHAPSTPRAVHADGEGRFALGVVDFGNVQLSATGPSGGTRAEDDVRNIRGDEKRDLQLGGLDAGATCTGRVLDEQGKPAAGATVGSYSWEASSEPQGTAVSAADGSYRVACEPRSELIVRASRGPAHAKGRGESGVELRLARGAHLRVRLLGHRPIEGAAASWIPASEIAPRVHFMSDPYERMRHSRTDGGLLELDDVPIGDPIELHIATRDGRTADGTATLPSGGAFEAVFDFDSMAAVALRPIDRKGGLVPALVCLEGKPRSAEECHESRRPERIVWRQLGPGPHVIHVYPADSLPWLHEVKGVARAVTLIGGETVDLGDVVSGAVRGGVPGLFLRDEGGALRVRRVARGSKADDAGLRKGDLLLAIDGKPVADRAAAREALAGEAGTPVELRVSRDGEERTIRLTREAHRPAWLPP